MTRHSNFFFFLALFLFLLVGRAEGQGLDARTLARLFSTAEQETGVPKYLLASIAANESSFNPWAINIAGKGYSMQSKEEALAKIRENDKLSYDLGLMQINSQWLPKFGLKIEEVIDPSVNVLLGSLILKDCLERHGTIHEGISCYHAGNGRDGSEYAQGVITGWSEFRK